LGSTLGEVTDQLGFTDGGPVHRRRTFALDPANTPITVLIGWTRTASTTRLWGYPRARNVRRLR
jgi:hypothetical protein